jgi:hypothetical protein
VSPQFHLKFDDEFIKVNAQFGNIIPTSEWQIKCGFTDKNNNKQNKNVNLKGLALIDQPLQLPETQLDNHDAVDINNMNLEPPSERDPEGEPDIDINQPLEDIIPPTREDIITTRLGRITGPPSYLHFYVVYGVTPSC